MFNKKIASEFALGVIVILAVALGGFLWWQGQSKNYSSTQPAQNNEANKVTNDVSATVPNESANWQTYRNEKYGFEFKYPADKMLVEGDGRSTVLMLLPIDYKEFDADKLRLSQGSIMINLYRADDKEIGVYNINKYNQIVNTQVLGDNQFFIDNWLCNDYISIDKVEGKSCVLMNEYGHLDQIDISFGTEEMLNKSEFSDFVKSFQYFNANK